MKTRNGFVSNSSSSSFVLKKSDLTDEQIRKIKEWKTEGLSFVTKCPNFNDREFTDEECRKCYDGDKECYDDYKEKCKDESYRESRGFPAPSDPIDHPEDWPDFGVRHPYEFPYCWNGGGTCWVVTEKESPWELDERRKWSGPSKKHNLLDEKGFLVITGAYGGDFPMQSYLKSLGITKGFRIIDVCCGDGLLIDEVTF